MSRSPEGYGSGASGLIHLAAKESKRPPMISLTIHTHNKTHPKYAFVPVLSITALVKEFSPVESVILPVRVKVAKFHGPDSIVAPNFCI